MENKILNLIKKQFPKQKFTKKKNLSLIKFTDIEGWDSLSSINFYLKIQNFSKKKINVAQIINFKTVKDLINFLKKND